MATLRRQVKNIVHNYTYAEVKVREATSNDPWGPSATLMSEIAQMTYSAEMHPEVMMMVWRRLNDSGKNWRHVYKGLTLLDYLIKNGSNKVVQECQENVIAVQTLKDFQFFDRDGRDQGISVREKAKVIVALLKDEEKLKQERTQAQTTRRRMSQVTSALDSRHRIRYNEASDSSEPSTATELEQARPQSTGEEELQLQLALAMSREEAEKRKEPSAPDHEEELQLQAALNKSKEEYEMEMRSHQGEISIIEKALKETQLSAERGEPETEKETHMSDLIDIFGPPQSIPSNTWDSHHASFFPSANTISLFPAWGPTTPQLRQADHAVSHRDFAVQLDTANKAVCRKKRCVPVPSRAFTCILTFVIIHTDQNSSTSSPSLPWDTPHSTQLKADNASQSIIFSCDSPSGWEAPPVSRSLPSDPWGDRQRGPNEARYDIFVPPPTTKDTQSPSSIKTDNSLELDFFGDSEHTAKPATDSPDLNAEDLQLDSKPRCNTPESFLEPAARTLINLESLVSYSSAVKTKNPFVSGVSASPAANPFQHGDLRPSLNQMRAASPVPIATATLPSMPMPGLMPTTTMDAGINHLRTLPPMPLFPVPTSLPMPLQSFPATFPLHPAMGYPYAQLPVTLPQQIVPAASSPQAGNNPFL
ncbi:PREDICTED: epsin-3 [Nanorana parkeri]|uniref:epsin-3 n=1 Tax=Nanorana parkeri TaxID=125878 RepID=UPI000854254D|nr:PREDICTED: epsin-3 [Nanorana parkeri]